MACITLAVRYKVCIQYEKNINANFSYIIIEYYGI